MKMHRTFLALGIVITLGTIIESTSATSSDQTSSLNPPDEVDESELEEVTRPIRASSSNSNPRKRGRGRSRKNGDGSVSKRRLPTATATARPTRAPLFEASPPDPFLEHGEVGPTVGAATGYGHSHSPPTPDPYYSPKMYERERRRHKIKLAGERLPQNSFDQVQGKNYAFAYAVGEDTEDFSHKQKKNGGLTVGEYRLTLPDGRTQVVRYTAGNKSGYKADVSYEPPDESHDAPIQISGGPHHQHHQNGQYLQSVQPTHHLGVTPSPKVYKSRPLKNIALHHEDNPNIEYSPASDDHVDFHHHPTPKIRSKGAKLASRIPPSPTPTTAEYLNGILSNPVTTPRPNSIYDKISPYRGGAVKYSGSDELAYAHEQSPRAGPQRAKKHKSSIGSVSSTAASFFDGVSPSPHSPLAVLKESLHPIPTKKYYASSGGRQPQANHVNEYVHPQKHVQYLQENPSHQRHQQHHTAIITKPVKNTGHHVVPLVDHHFKAGPTRTAVPFAHAHTPLIAIPKKKLKKNKHHHHHNHHSFHQNQNQFLLPSPYPVTATTGNHLSPYQQSITPTAITAAAPVHTGPGALPQLPFHYYNSLHHGHQSHLTLSASPSPTPVTSVTHHDTPFPLTFTSGGGSLNHNHHHQQLFTGTGGSTGPGYLETPPSGDRPNRHGVKEVLSRLPSHDLATPKTTVHPYEVGSVDYGKSVAYGLAKPLDAKGFPEAHYGGHGHGLNAFPTAGGLDHLDPTNSLFSSPGVGHHHHQLSGNGNSNGNGVGYFPNDVDEHFNFLDGLTGFDVEQANVREIRQNRPRGRSRKPQVQRGRPDLKRRGLPAASSSSSSESDEENKSRRIRGRSTSSPKPKSQSKSQSQSTTQRSRGRRRRTKTPGPVTPTPTDPMMHAVETRRSRPRGRSNNKN